MHHITTIRNLYTIHTTVNEHYHRMTHYITLQSQQYVIPYLALAQPRSQPFFIACLIHLEPDLTDRLRTKI